ncbi:MAG: glutamate formimidoyltransferase [Planctomycetota bacterium]
MAGLLECVPNISDGRRPHEIEAIADAFASAGATPLGVDADADHNRTVITLAGTAQQVIDGAVAGVRAARDRIDLNRHHGAHPRMGATDVVPFIPLAGSSMDDAVAAARTAAERIWNELRVPTYLYAKAAMRPERADLAAVRRGQFEGIRDTIAVDPRRLPDFGEAAVHPTAGITAVGARFFLVAYNVNLASRDLELARRIAKSIREKDGGLPAVKAMGFDLPEQRLVQVSMNLVDYRTTSPTDVFDVIAAKAKEAGVEVAGSEVVGLIPAEAAPEGFRERVQAHDFDADEQVIERRLARARG